MSTSSSSYVSIANFGAVADGVTDNRAAIQAAINYAAVNDGTVFIPAGTFAYSGQIEDPGVAITGTGVTSILKALDPTNEDIHITGNGASVSYISMQGNGTSRLSCPWNEPIWADHATNYTVANVTINNGPAGSIMNDGSSGGLIENNTITNSLADSITAIDGASNITIKGNLIENSGDDAISVVSYVGSPVVHDITIQGNTVLGNNWGRGITDVGGNNVQITGNHIEGGTAGAAGIYIAAENGWNTQGVNGCTVSGNTIIDGGGAPSGTGQGAITVFNGQGSAYTIQNVTISGNQIVNPRANAFQWVGNGSETVSATNNTVYGGATALVSNGNSLASVTMSGNQQYPASSYATPLVPAGGGAAAEPPAPSAPPASVTVGSGSDTLVLSLSEDAYQGDAQFTVSVDGQQIGGTLTATASHSAGQDQTFTLKGDWAPGAHTLAVNFLNDAWGGSATADRNLYVNSVTYDGVNTNQSAGLMKTGAQNFSLTDNTAVPGSGGATSQPSAPVTVGSGSDTLVLSLSEDAYQGDAQFTVSVDGQQIAGTFTALASHAAGAGQTFTFKGDWAPGAHTVAVNFLNDAYGGSAATDRNLYVNSVTYDGVNTNQSAGLMKTGAQNFSLTDNTAVPPAVIGSGSDMLTVQVAEDAYQGDAQFTVSVDGQQIGGTLTATTLHSSGGNQAFAFAGDFGAGPHTVAVNFLNDAYGGSAATDRNLYVNSISYNGANTNQSAALLSNGAHNFSVSGGTMPSVTETGDHGSLQQSLSQTGTYAVGSDYFVLSSGDAVSVALGTGTSSIAFIGASSAKLTGGSGQSTVTADSGTNTFTAGSGSLDVTGGGGADTYVFHAASGLLTIENFSVAQGDHLVVDKSLQGSMMQASDGQGGVMLSFGSGSAHAVDLHGIAALPSSAVSWA